LRQLCAAPIEATDRADSRIGRFRGSAVPQFSGSVREASDCDLRSVLTSEAIHVQPPLSSVEWPAIHSAPRYRADCYTRSNISIIY